MHVTCIAMYYLPTSYSRAFSYPALKLQDFAHVASCKSEFSDMSVAIDLRMLSTIHGSTCAVEHFSRREVLANSRTPQTVGFAFMPSAKRDCGVT